MNQKYVLVDNKWNSAIYLLHGVLRSSLIKGYHWWSSLNALPGIYNRMRVPIIQECQEDERSGSLLFMWRVSRSLSSFVLDPTSGDPLSIMHEKWNITICYAIDPLSARLIIEWILWTEGKWIETREHVTIRVPSLDLQNFRHTYIPI